MKIQKEIHLYSAFPLLDAKPYFVQRAIFPIEFKQEVDPVTFLPVRPGFPNSYLLQIEHELGLNDAIALYSSFIDDGDFEPIIKIANDYNAVVHLTYLELPMPNMYELYKRAGGNLSYLEFTRRYQEAFSFPSGGVNKLAFENLI
ncbi:hypothetical protein [Bacillus toyonensis]|uniref:hypothetical protein n=1 Tax=Bacillus toyonensis TaxID=155322 RepID=UPI002E1F9A07|nr:hypothetical protein [Bacillus toyonensis]